MNMRSPPTLLKLAVQSLLRDKDVAMGAMEDLPGDLFPPVFTEAFTGGHEEVLKAMMLSWPFPCLPLGELMKAEKAELSLSLLGAVLVQKRNWQILQAVLDGLDELLTREVSARRLKPQAVDTRAGLQGFPRVRAGNLEEACSSEAPKRRKTEKSGPRAAEKQPLTLILDIWIQEGHLGVFSSRLLSWTQERKEERKAFVTDFPSQFLKLHCLREIYLDSVFFLEGHLAQVLSCVPQHGVTSLLHCSRQTGRATALARRKSGVSDSKGSFAVPSLGSTSRIQPRPTPSAHGRRRGLAAADISASPLAALSVQHSGSEVPVPGLLTNTAATLTSLHLEACGMTEAQLRAILPALGRCSQLTTLKYLQNPLSVDALEKLLGRTARLSNLSLEMYEAPPEVHGPPAAVPWLRRDRVCSVLRNIMKRLRHQGQSGSLAPTVVSVVTVPSVSWFLSPPPTTLPGSVSACTLGCSH
ncbi:PRAME family member 20-like [Erethizon dorsatum]